MSLNVPGRRLRKIFEGNQIRIVGPEWQKITKKWHHVTFKIENVVLAVISNFKIINLKIVFFRKIFLN